MLPAHRYLDRVIEERKAAPDQPVVVFDYDETITKAPTHLAFFAKALRMAGAHVIVLTGNDMPRADLIQSLDDFGFPFDDLLQYEDDESTGLVRAEHLKAFGAWLGVDNRIDRSPTYIKVCPHLFLVARPPKVAKADAKGTQKVAKQAAKKLGLRSAAIDPSRPQARPPDFEDPAQGPHACAECVHYTPDVCGLFNYGVRPGAWCSKFDPAPSATEDE